jgi:general secretion pathway protein G
MMLCKKSKNMRRAFSLLELMVVLVILGMLSGIVAFKTRSYLAVAKQKTAQVDIKNICVAIDTFNLLCGRYPTNEEGLAILTKPNGKLSEGLLEKVPNDPWGNPYQYNNPGQNGPYDVICYGGSKNGTSAGAEVTICNNDDKVMR